MGRDAFALLARLRADGLVIALHNDRIHVTPRERLNERRRGEIRDHRRELVASLALENRIRDMAQRWQYSAQELAEALADAAADPAASSAWVTWDELWTGGGIRPFEYAVPPP